MKLRHLKPLRVIVAILFLATTATLFLDVRDFDARLVAREILYPQFVPSLLSFLKVVSIGGTGFIAVFILTVLFGRVYCSTLCPLGTLQDVLVVIIRKRKRRIQRNYRYSKPKNKLRYTFLGMTIITWLLGGGLVLNTLDPYSAFGRVMSNLFRPGVIFLNNALARILETAGIHTIYRIPWPTLAISSIVIATIPLVLIVVLAIKGGRTYCNTVCPVGALLGLVSRLAIFKIVINSETCTNCGLCEKVCKSSCVNASEKSIDMSRCVGCFNCFTVCGTDAVRYESVWSTHTGSTETIANPRRFFFISAALWLAGTARVMAQITQITQSNPTTIPVPKTTPVSPPGSISIDRFTSQCTACHLCVSVCPSHVITPAFLEYGLTGIALPRLNFNAGHCNYDCVACLEICPSGAILPLSVEEKRLTQMGMARFIKENCVVYTDETNCGACSEHCPTKAVHMVPYTGSSNRDLVIPEVNEDICVGCGGCEYACPTNPYKAIYVAGNAVHQLAKKPEEEKIEIQSDMEEDFPF